MADLSIGNWIPSCQSLRSHSKRKRLSRQLDIGLHETVGLLICLWWWAIDEAEDGDLTRFSDQDIADGADWDGDADKLVAALVDAGFMTETRVLVNWWKYVGKLLEGRNYRREVDRARQERWRRDQAARLAAAESNGGVTRDRDVTDDVVTGDSPASHAAAARDSLEGERDAPSEAADPPAAPPPKAPAEPPEELREFDSRLRAMPGYNPSADFYRLVLEKYSRLDLNEQAFLMAQWQGDPQRNKKKRKGTTLFVVSWLKRELADAPIQFAAHAGGARNGRVGGAMVADAPAEAWDGALLLDDDEPPPGIDLDDAFGGTDARA
jgi:hypothetical protein